MNPVPVINPLRFLLSFLVVAAFAVELRAANNEQSVPGGAESLGGRLLDDLSPTKESPATNKPLLQQPAEATPPARGFGVGADPAAQPLVRVRRDMQSAESLLAQPGAGARPGTVRLAGTVQQKVLSELDQLIAELSKQCQGGQCQGGQCQGGQSQGGNPSPKPGSNSQAKSGKPGTATSHSNAPARDSNDRLDRTNARPVDKGDVDELVKTLWGQLPQRSREQMLQSFSDEFLPKYELEIEQYYRRLSEEQNKGASR